ncbi:melanocyte-stimulating hormone receptor-like [Porites lutea]|uniref:melanocyte-stimulating hormone receptor-like n=1 Tax=Porites lutea TaxID=51062 RepID=UPI003CC61F65
MVNSTEGRNVTVMKTLLSANLPVGFYIALTAVNIVLSITASLGNILILIALRKVTSIHPPTKLLFQCLAITDLGVGLISQPLMAAKFLAVYIKNLDFKIWNISLYPLLWSSSIIFSGVSSFASTALSVDRLLALFLMLRYRHVVTLKRIRAVLASCCLTALLTVLGIYPRLSFILNFTGTLVFLNSSLNPFLYCWRIKEIRQAVKATIRRFCACLSQGTSTLSTNQ